MVLQSSSDCLFVVSEFNKEDISINSFDVSISISIRLFIPLKTLVTTMAGKLPSAVNLMDYSGRSWGDVTIAKDKSPSTINLMDYAGRPWSDVTFAREKDVPSTATSNAKTSTSGAVEYTQTTRLLPRKDYSMYGEFPKLEEKFLVECNKCGAVLLPCVLKAHSHNTIPRQKTSHEFYSTHPRPLSMVTRSLRKVGNTYLLQNQRLEHQRAEMRTYINSFQHRPNILKNSARNNLKVTVKHSADEKPNSEDIKQARLEEILALF